MGSEGQARGRDGRGIVIPGIYRVGGRRVTKPTGKARDSSLRDRKAPGNTSTRTPQLRPANLGPPGEDCQRESRREDQPVKPGQRISQVFKPEAGLTPGSWRAKPAFS